MLYVFPTGLYRYNLFAEQLSLDASHTTLKKPVRSSPRAYIFLASINYWKPQAFSYWKVHLIRAERGKIKTWLKLIFFKVDPLNMRHPKAVFLLISKLNIVLGDTLFSYNCWPGLNSTENSSFGSTANSTLSICIHKHFTHCLKCLTGSNGKNSIQR